MPRVKARKRSANGCRVDAEFAEFRNRGAGPVYRGAERFLKKTLYLTQLVADNTGSAPHSVGTLLFQNLAKLMSTYRLEYTTAVPACHMGMVYTLEESIQIVAHKHNPLSGKCAEYSSTIDG